MVQGQRRRTHPDLSKGRVHHNHQSQGVQSAQEPLEDHVLFVCRESTGQQRGEAFGVQDCGNMQLEAFIQVETLILSLFKGKYIRFLLL